MLRSLYPNNLKSLSLIFILIACSTAKKMDFQGEESFKITKISSIQNPYEGNLIVQVYDWKGKPLSGTTVRVYHKSRIISAGENLKSETWVAQILTEPYEVIVTKEGFEEVVTDKIHLDEEYDHLVQIRMKHR